MSAPRTFPDSKGVVGSYPALAQGKGRVSGRRVRLAGLLLSLAAATVLMVGGWGLLASLAGPSAPARMGEDVAVPGGLVRVDGVTQESMAPMQAKKFTASGMSMSSMGMDMAPEGQRRFSVEVALAAGENDFRYSPRDFRIAGKGMAESGPIRSQLDAGTVSPGQAVSGNLLFQAPEAASGLMLSFDGGREISLDLEPISGPEDPHGGVSGDGHDH